MIFSFVVVRPDGAVALGVDPPGAPLAVLSCHLMASIGDGFLL
jgi:hypothetical protein